uniref:Uncharacterized protein n=1 Tax=Rhizophora mucronata TaxID=61149 RepID=A0A2P2QAX2_RHIMU
MNSCKHHDSGAIKTVGMDNCGFSLAFDDTWKTNSFGLI